MYPSGVKDYLLELYRRRSEARVTLLAKIEGGNWQPSPKACHENVEIFCEHSVGFDIVRGWFYFDLPDTPGCAMFVAHSVVRTPQGVLSDITPQAGTTSRRYPFLEALVSDEEFFLIESSTEEGKLFYNEQDYA
ncbi:hypothetical protein [Reinekea sp. G2M2-21]|uniref:hypothetical protein n=1 Tax=Reinekea sp. G2M2-21 TaxID=2788942 RepID=UPI0018AB7301|nr:hypothetical protein [Reinekea sp. G2M2-21]